MNRLLSELGRKSAKLERLAAGVIRQPVSLVAVFEGLGADKAKVRYGCLKLLRIISEQKPAVLYPEIDRVFRLLDNENNILKWGALIIIGNLAAEDCENKIDQRLDKYLQPISGHVMITAANVISGAGKIASAKPLLADRIARALLQVETADYQTAECRNVALGQVVESLGMFYSQLKHPQPVDAFMRRQLRNSRNAVRRKAATFLKKQAIRTRPRVVS